MTREYCDLCGKDCAGYRLVVHATIYHKEGQGHGDLVGIDELRPRDLCQGCAEPFIAAYGLTLMVRRDEDDPPAIAFPEQIPPRRMAPEDAELARPHP